MPILVINCGSSTLKFDLIKMDRGDKTPSPERRLVSGMVDKIASGGIFKLVLENGKSHRENIPINDHSEALNKVLTWLKDSNLLGTEGLSAVGFRLAHGGYKFSLPALIDKKVLEAIEEVTELAPLHNGPMLKTIYAAKEFLGPKLPMVAVFDTAFHRTLPDRASHYAIPQDLADKHHIRRYGFHGTAHKYMVEHYSKIISKPTDKLKLITLQLGNGCSIAAVSEGISVDTSMGLTPLEGLIMGTRSGDVDPSLICYLAKCEGVSNEEVESWLNKRSGLLGISGRSRDMRELLEAEKQGDKKASLAVEMFCYRVRKYIGSYLAVLGGADAIIFGGGIGENAVSVRERSCSGMDWCGLILDPKRNSELMGVDGRISSDKSSIDVYTIHVDEALMIARETATCLKTLKK